MAKTANKMKGAVCSSASSVPWNTGTRLAGSSTARAAKMAALASQTLGILAQMAGGFPVTSAMCVLP